MPEFLSSGRLEDAAQALEAAMGQSAQEENWPLGPDRGDGASLLVEKTHGLVGVTGKTYKETHHSRGSLRISQVFCPWMFLDIVLVVGLVA